MPSRDCTEGEFEALLANDSVAEESPADCGLKVTVKEADFPAAIVVGREIPESVNSLLFRVAEETVTDAPLAVRVPPSADEFPTITLPKIKVVGETANVPDWVPVPVPESAILSGELEAFDTTAKVPLVAPELAGAKITVNVVL